MATCLRGGIGMLGLLAMACTGCGRPPAVSARPQPPRPLCFVDIAAVARQHPAWREAALPAPASHGAVGLAELPALPAPIGRLTFEPSAALPGAPPPPAPRWGAPQQERYQEESRALDVVESAMKDGLDLRLNELNVACESERQRRTAQAEEAIARSLAESVPPERDGTRGESEGQLRHLRMEWAALSPRLLNDPNVPQEVKDRLRERRKFIRETIAELEKSRADAASRAQVWEAARAMEREQRLAAARERVQGEVAQEREAAERRLRQEFARLTLDERKNRLAADLAPFADSGFGISDFGSRGETEPSPVPRSAIRNPPSEPPTPPPPLPTIREQRSRRQQLQQTRRRQAEALRAYLLRDTERKARQWARAQRWEWATTRTADSVDRTQGCIAYLKAVWSVTGPQDATTQSSQSKKRQEMQK